MLSKTGRAFLRHFYNCLTTLAESQKSLNFVINGIEAKNLHPQIAQQAKYPERYRCSSLGRPQENGNPINPFLVIDLLPEIDKTELDKNYKITSQEHAIEYFKQHQETPDIDYRIILSCLMLYISFNQDNTLAYFLGTPAAIGSDNLNSVSVATKVNFAPDIKRYSCDFTTLYKLKKIYYAPTEAYCLKPDFIVLDKLYPSKDYFSYHRPVNKQELQPSRVPVQYDMNVSFMFLPLIKASTLSEWLSRQDFLLTDVALIALLYKITLEVYLVHVLGYIIKDIKPANILVNTELIPQVTLIDLEQPASSMRQPTRHTEGVTTTFSSPSKGSAKADVTFTPRKTKVAQQVAEQDDFAVLQALCKSHTQYSARLKASLLPKESVDISVMSIVFLTSTEAKSDIFSLGLVFWHIILWRIARLSFENFLIYSNLVDAFSEYLINLHHPKGIDVRNHFIEKQLIPAIQQFPLNRGSLAEIVREIVINMLNPDKEQRWHTIKVFDKLISIYKKINNAALALGAHTIEDDYLADVIGYDDLHLEEKPATLD